MSQELPPIPPNPYDPGQHHQVSDPTGENNFPEPPLDDPYYQGSFFQGLWETFRGALFNPVPFFSGIREDRSPMPAITLALFVLIIQGLVNLTINFIFNATMGTAQIQELWETLVPNIPYEDYSQLLNSGFGIQLIMLPVSILVTFFIGLVINFAFAKIFKTHMGSFGKFARMYAYSCLPFIFGFSFFGWMMWIWNRTLLAIALVKGENAPVGFAILTVLSPLILACCFGALCVGVFMMLMAGGLASAA